LTIAVLIAAQHVVELPVKVALLLVVEAAHLVVAVLTDALDDVRRLRQLGCQLREPEQRLLELQVIRVVGDDAEDRVACLVKLQPVKRDGEEVLGQLLVARVVASLAAHHALQRLGGFVPAFLVEQLLRGGSSFGHGAGGHGGGGGFLAVVEVDVDALLLPASSRLRFAGFLRSGFLVEVDDVFSVRDARGRHQAGDGQSCQHANGKALLKHESSL